MRVLLVLWLGSCAAPTILSRPEPEHVHRVPLETPTSADPLHALLDAPHGTFHWLEPSAEGPICTSWRVHARHGTVDLERNGEREPSAITARFVGDELMLERARVSGIDGFCRDALPIDPDAARAGDRTFFADERACRWARDDGQLPLTPGPCDQLRTLLSTPSPPLATDPLPTLMSSGAELIELENEGEPHCRAWHFRATPEHTLLETVGPDDRVQYIVVHRGPRLAMEGPHFSRDRGYGDSADVVTRVIRWPSPHVLMLDARVFFLEHGACESAIAEGGHGAYLAAR